MFKFLLVIAVVVLGYLWWRHQRLQQHNVQRAAHKPTSPQAQVPGPTPMIRCRHCGVHIPAADAVRGALGPYCSDEHRRLAEGG